MDVTPLDSMLLDQLAHCAGNFLSSRWNADGLNESWDVSHEYMNILILQDIIEC